MNYNIAEYLVIAFVSKFSNRKWSNYLDISVNYRSIRQSGHTLLVQHCSAVFDLLFKETYSAVSMYLYVVTY